jgi:hypothetical protein
MTSLLSLLSAVPGLGQLITLAINWWAKRQADIQAAAASEKQAEADHSNDAVALVASHDSIDAQQAALDSLKHDLDNPSHVEITLPKGQS